MNVIKLLRPEEWSAFLASGEFAGSEDDLRDGFIHLSTPEQAMATAEKWFSGVEGLMEISFDADELGTDLRWEASRGGQMFPHYYSRLKLDAIISAQPFAR